MGLTKLWTMLLSSRYSSSCFFRHCFSLTLHRSVQQCSVARGIALCACGARSTCGAPVM